MSNNVLSAGYLSSPAVPTGGLWDVIVEVASLLLEMKRQSSNKPVSVQSPLDQVCWTSLLNQWSMPSSFECSWNEFRTYLCMFLPHPKVSCDAEIVSVQSLSRVQLFGTPWIAACQASLSFTISQSLLKLMSIVSVMPSNHLILCHPLLFLPSIFPSIRVSSNESALLIRWLKYWSFSFSISPSN